MVARLELFLKRFDLRSLRVPPHVWQAPCIFPRRCAIPEPFAGRHLLGIAHSFRTALPVFDQAGKYAWTCGGMGPEIRQLKRFITKEEKSSPL